MATGRILIIAPDPDLRRSLEFALGAEGYAVTCRTRLDEEPEPEAYDCTILDHRAIPVLTGDVLTFCRRAKPIVLLAGMPQPWLAEHVFCVVQKPMLGEPLSGAVRAALAWRRTAGPH